MDKNAPKDFQQRQIMNLLALDSSDIEEIQTQTGKDHAIVRITLKRDRPACGRCGRLMVSNGYREVETKHAALTHSNCTLLTRIPRWKCPICHKTLEQKLPFTHKSGKISILTARLILKDLKSPSATFSQTAQRYDLSSVAVAKIFDRYVQYPEPNELPEVLLMDEVYAFSSESSNFVLVALDMVSQIPVEVLPSRKKEDVRKFYMKFSLEQRKKVKFFCSDMHDPYQDLARELLPSAIRAIDRFHVIQDARRRMNQVRLRVQKGYGKKTDAYYLLKNQHRLLNITPDDRVYDKHVAYSKRKRKLDPSLPKDLNQKLKKAVNDNDLLEMLLDLSPDLRLAYEFVCDLSDFFKLRNQEKAKERLEELILDALTSPVPELNDLGKTLGKWKQEILNSFIIVYSELDINGKTGAVKKIDHRLTSSLIENKNNIIQILKKSSCGYGCWERFRNRILYVLKKEPPSDLAQEAMKEKTESGSSG